MCGWGTVDPSYRLKYSTRSLLPSLLSVSLLLFCVRCSMKFPVWKYGRCTVINRQLINSRDRYGNRRVRYVPFPACRRRRSPPTCSTCWRSCVGGPFRRRGTVLRGKGGRGYCSPSGARDRPTNRPRAERGQGVRGGEGRRGENGKGEGEGEEEMKWRNILISSN